MVKTSRPTFGDLVLVDIDTAFNYESRVAPSAVTDQVLDAGTTYEVAGNGDITIPATTPANIDGVLCDSITIPAGETMVYKGIERGPAVLNASEIVYGAMTPATVDARLAVLGFVLRDDPSQ